MTRAGFLTEKVKYEYDNNGNTLVKVKETTRPVDPDMAGSFAFAKAGTTTTREAAFMEYNVWNQLSKTIDGDKTLTYRYNGEGYRVEKAVNDQITRYLYEADKVILEVDGQGNETARNVYGSNLFMREAGSEKYYYMYNGHGDVTALLGRNGEISATYYYDAFGNITEETGDADNPIRYAGYQYDEETGIYYLNARYYDPKIARFLTEDTYRGDPNDPLSLNLYTYCHNEPMMYTDPSGHSLLSLIGIGTAIAAGVKAVVNIVSNANKESSKKDKDKDKSTSKGKGSSNKSSSNSEVIQTKKPKGENLNDKGGSGLANMVNQILAGIEQLKAVMKSKDTRTVLGANTGSNDFLSRYPGAVASNIIIPGMYSEDTIGYWGTNYPGGTIGTGYLTSQGTGKPEVLVVFAAGINTNVSTGIFEDMEAELKERYAAEGKTVRFVTVYPLGEVKDVIGKAATQSVEVGYHMQYGTGGEEVVEAVFNNKEIGTQIVLIGHSGGGQAVGDATVALENSGIDVYHTVQIGAPTERIDKKYVDKFTRVQARSDVVSNYVRFGTEVLNPKGAITKYMKETITHKMPETRYVDIDTKGQAWGGHSAYFNSELVNESGIDNVTTTVDAFWDKVK